MRKNEDFINLVLVSAARMFEELMGEQIENTAAIEEFLDHTWTTARFRVRTDVYESKFLRRYLVPLRVLVLYRKGKAQEAYHFAHQSVELDGKNMRLDEAVQTMRKWEARDCKKQQQSLVTSNETK
jgi:hypothetical protein